MATKAVAKKEETALAEAWGDYAGATGYEDADRSELAIPFINLLQSNSELVEENKAKAGQFFNNVMETIHDSLTIIPCARQRVFVEWVPIDDGGGLVAVHEPDSAFVQKAISLNDGSTRDIKVADGKHELIETIYLFVLVLDEDGNAERAVISFSSSKLKKYRQFFTKATSQTVAVNGRKIKLPLWAHRWTVVSEDDVSKTNGRKFKNISLQWDGDTAKECRLTPRDELFAMGQGFHDMVAGGEAKADLSTVDKAEGSSEDGEEIPF
ncbi:gp11 [Alphaproteobacteria phage PhiJL001]|uniref:Gp11 n=1 Tax=Alphaproteobacteria phage PhiJL001 TaxID=2681607 RepID=Q5DN94_9CAUD|nr:gp11 [Alphaproteobacteria phage PhiJL001]AAT69487.1 gp11 [Alphaproteobacteria phage PhiJL001]